jgi:SAM-dependent methyltransferase
MNRCLRCESLFDGDGWKCPDCGYAPTVEQGVPMFAPALAREIAGYEPHFFETHGGVQAERSFWPQARAALISWALDRYAPGCRSFLEIGCGTGAMLAQLEQTHPDLRLVGAEALVEGLYAARSRLSRTTLIQLDARSLPFDSTFEAAGTFDVIEHIADDDAVLAAMARALRPGGVLLVTVPQHPFLFGPADVDARHIRRYSSAGLVAQVGRLGLQLECVTSFVSLLFPAMAAVRLKSKWQGGSYDIADEFRIGPLNGLFAKIMDIERWTIQRGLRWPFGGSLLLVARKPLA